MSAQFRCPRHRDLPVGHRDPANPAAQKLPIDVAVGVYGDASQLVEATPWQPPVARVSCVPLPANVVIVPFVTADAMVQLIGDEILPVAS